MTDHNSPSTPPLVHHHSRPSIPSRTSSLLLNTNTNTNTANNKRHSTRSFTARISHFDRTNAQNSVNAFRGFYTLFWILMAVAGLRTLLRTYTDEGIVLGFEFARFIGADALNLALSDGVLVGSTILCVPFIRLITRGKLRYSGAGIIIQHIVQTLFLGFAISWTFHRQWAWVQSGFLTLHALSMLMKVHSYLSTNGELSEKALKFKSHRATLEELILAAGGINKVESVAEATYDQAVASGEAKDYLSAGEGSLPTAEDVVDRRPRENEPNLGSPPETPKAPLSPVLTHRRPRPSFSTSSDRPVMRSPSKDKKEEDNEDEVDLMDYIDALTWSPDEHISSIANEMTYLRDALTSTGVNKVVWPANVTYLNYLDYLLVPTLVYELEYPRLNKIRPMYIVEKAAATFGTFSVLLLVTEKYILPISPSTHENSFLVSALDLSIPFMINYLLIFYIIFECICNAFAEITRFADREFYQDWWNSTSFDEFSRRWNIPVHAFLLRHVYTSTITNYRFSKFQAAFTTFLLSALVHELVMAVVTKKLRLYLFVLQMCQLPLIMLGRLPVFKQYPALGNTFFWLGLGSGFPILAVAYIRW